MGDDVAAVSAVQCSVIQYCPDNVPPIQVIDSGNSVCPGQKSENSESGSDKVNSSDKVDNAPCVNNVDKEIICSSTPAVSESVDVNSEAPVEEVSSNNDLTVEVPEIIEEKPNISDIAVKQDCKETTNWNECDLKEECVKTEGDEKLEAKKEEVGSAWTEDEQTRGVKREADHESREVVPNKKKKKAMVNGELKDPSPPPPLDEPEEEEEEELIESESDEEVVNKPRRRGRCKKNPQLIPPHLAHDIELGYRMLLKFIETPQFSGFLRPGNLNAPPPSPLSEDSVPEQITSLNQMKKKFEENSYKSLAEFVGDVRSMLTSVYTAPRNPVAVKRALRLEQVLEQRIAQLPNYMRPQCSLVLSQDEVSNSPKKIRINKGGGFVSLLLERADKLRAEKDREKRKVLAEERKQLKEEQDKDVQDWEKNVLLKDHEEEIKSMWELPQIGHFIHLCANILNIGDVSQYEVERMLLMPQCSETLDLLVTALLSNSLVRAKLDRTPSMPYTIWSYQVRTRVNAWYRAYHREFRNAQKVFEEIGVESEFWDVVGPDHSPLDYFYLHEIPLIQRVWILKTLCDVDFVRKKTVYDNMRQQVLEELQGNNLGVDRHGNRYIHFPQFGMTAVRIYRQGTVLEDGIKPSDLVESQEGFEERRGEITIDKVFRDIWDVGTKADPPSKKAKKKKKSQNENVVIKVKMEPTAPKSLRQSARAKRKVYVDSSDSDCSDTDLATLKSKLYDSQTKPEKNFISLTVFRLPRDKVKPVSNKKSYYCRKLEREEAERLRLEEREANKDKLSADEDASESMEPRLDDDEDDEGKENFTVKNLENLKMVLKKGPEENDNATDGSVKEEDKFRYTTPANLQPDRNKFYCVVDSVDGLRQLISQFASDDNDLEIINRSTRRSSGKKSGKSVPASPSCEVQLIERLQKLVDDLEAWEMDYVKTSRTIREKLHKEYTNFINRPADFVHPNEAYWQKWYEEPAPLAPPAEPEPLPEETPALEPEAGATPAPPSPLGGLRPRTRTRQQQHVAKVEEAELDEELLDDELESSESDDNWEMPISKKKRNRSGTEASKLVTSTLRVSKRSPKKNSRNASPGGADGNERVDKAKRALFWSPRSSDPSEELTWETNRQKILEKHNSPKKVIPGDIESEMSEVENALRTTATSGLKTRILPPPVPGNRKPYFSPAQIKAMAKKKDTEIQIIGQKTNVVSQHKMARKPATSRMIKAVAKKSAGTQSNEVIDLASDGEKLQPTITHEEYFITDGVVYIKIEYSFVQELIKNQEAVRKFADRLDLNKKIQIVKKKVETPAPESVIQNNAMVSQNALAQTSAMPEPAKTSGLRFIRPQNVPTQVQFLRPTQRMASPQPNFVYVQTTQPQGLVQLQPANRTPGLMQVLTRPTTPGASPQSFTTFSQAKPEDGVVVNTSQVDIMGLLSSASTPNQVGFIQVQAGSKQPVQFVQVSQANAGMVQAATPGIGAHAAQNMIRLASTAPNTLGVQTAPSFVRLASTGQIVQLTTAPPAAGAVAFKPSAAQPGAAAQPASTSQVNLLQVQGLPGEPISYIPLPGGMKSIGGSLVQIQGPIKGSGQMGTFVQVASPPRQQTPQGRMVQVQGSPRAQGVVQVQVQRSPGSVGQTVPRPQTSVVQMSPTRPQGAAAQCQTTLRPQTTVVQVYGAPRMQTTMMQIQGSPRPQMVQVRSALVPMSQQQQVSMSQGGVLQTNPRPMGTTTMVVSQGMQQGSPRPVAMSQAMPQQNSPRPTNTIVSMSQTMQQQSGLRPMGTVVSQPMQQASSRPAGMVQLSQALQQQGSPRAITTTGLRPAGAMSQPGNQNSVRPSGNMVIQMSQALQQQSGLRPAGTLVSMSQPMQQQNSPRPGGNTVVQLSQAYQQQGSPRPSQQGSPRPSGATTVVSMSQGIQQQNSIRPGNTIVQLSHAAQLQNNPRLATHLRPSLQRPTGPIIRVQATPRAQLPSVQYTNAVRPVQGGILAQTLTVAGKAGADQATKPTSTQVVQMPLSGGKQGFFQIQNAAGQQVSIVQVVTSGQPTITTMPSLVQVQSSPLTQGKQLQNAGLAQGSYIQIHPTSTSTSTSGLVQLSAGARPQLVQIQGAQGGLRPSASPSKQQAVYSIQMAGDESDASGGTQTVRLVSADTRAGTAFALQPMLVRAAGSKAPVSSSGRVVTQSQPVMIRLEEDDDEIKIVRENVLSVASAPETVDILHGELSAKETAEGWRYSVKTTTGKDHVLTNAQVEARRAANNGRMF